MGKNIIKKEYALQIMRSEFNDRRVQKGIRFRFMKTSGIYIYIYMHTYMYIYIYIKQI